MNYAAGKSECLVALRGKGAKAVRERVFVGDKARISVESQTGTLLLRVVDAYKHLGGIVTSSGSQSRELQARIKAMNAGVAALNRPVMGRHEIPVEDKLFCMLARGRVSDLLKSERYTKHACTFFDVPPTCTEAAMVTMRLIVKFWWLLDVVQLMCRLQC